jgi:hypothetical protein
MEVMNKHATQHAIEVMQAFVNGKTIQSKSGAEGWFDNVAPAWNWPSVDYRVKPEPRSAWVAFWTDGEPLFVASEDQYNANKFAWEKNRYTLVKCVEQLSEK